MHGPSPLNLECQILHLRSLHKAPCLSWTISTEYGGYIYLHFSFLIHPSLFMDDLCEIRAVRFRVFPFWGSINLYCAHIRVVPLLATKNPVTLCHQAKNDILSPSRYSDWHSEDFQFSTANGKDSIEGINFPSPETFCNDNGFVNRSAINLVVWQLTNLTSQAFPRPKNHGSTYPWAYFAYLVLYSKRCRLDCFHQRQ